MSITSMSYEEMSSTGSRDDISSEEEPAPLETAPHPPAAFYQHLHVWLVLHDRHNYLALKNERIDAEGTPESIQEREAEGVECRTTEINMERARASLRDWLRAHDSNGDWKLRRDNALSELNPRFDERRQLMRRVVDTYSALRNTPTSSSAMDERYNTAQEEYNQATNDHAANELVIATLIASVKTAWDAARDRACDGLPEAPVGGPVPSGGALMTPEAVFARARTQPSGPAGLPKDTIFSGTKIASAYGVIPEHRCLQWPDNNERSGLMARAQVNSLRAGFVLPILHFTGPESFATLNEPDGYYIVIAEYQDNSTRLALAYKNPACARALPPGLTFAARAEPYSVVTMADAAIRGNIWEQHVMNALRSLNVPLTAPDTPLAQRATGPSGLGGYGSRDAQAKADKTMLPLRRALHNDKGKLQRITQHAAEQKLTDPAIATAIRNMQTSTALHGLPVMLPDHIPHLLGFNWCIDPEFTGSSKKADALSIALFLKNRTGEVRTLQSFEDIRQAIENMKSVYTTIAMEDRSTEFPFYTRLFNQLNDQLMDTADFRSIRHLHIDFLVRQLNKMFTAWSHLFKMEKHMNTAIEDFFRVNEAILRFNPVEWLDQYARVDIKQIPPQKGYRLPGRDDEHQQRRGKRQAPYQPDRRRDSDRDDQKRRRREPSPPRRGKKEKTPPAAAAPSKQTPKAGPAPKSDLCLRHLFHQAAPATFKQACTRKPCPRSHNPVLHNGKLDDDDKKAVRANLQQMEGNFAAQALQQLDTLF